MIVHDNAFSADSQRRRFAPNPLRVSASVMPERKENEIMDFVKHVLICQGLLLLLVGCGATNSADEYVAEFSLLDGNDFVLEVDRISESPNVQFPMDDLQESDYEETNEGTQYNVAFSEDGQMVTIEPGSIRGQKTNDGDESKLYELDEGVFAGGRFVVWINNDSFEAELTIYGSGVPIVISERGYLAPEQ